MVSYTNIKLFVLFLGLVLFQVAPSEAGWCSLAVGAACGGVLTVGTGGGGLLITNAACAPVSSWLCWLFGGRRRRATSDVSIPLR